MSSSNYLKLCRSYWSNSSTRDCKLFNKFVRKVNTRVNEYTHFFTRLHVPRIKLGR